MGRSKWTQIADGSPPLQHYFEKSSVAHRRNDAEMVPANSITRFGEYDEDSIWSVMQSLDVEAMLAERYVQSCNRALPLHFFQTNVTF